MMYHRSFFITVFFVSVSSVVVSNSVSDSIPSDNELAYKIRQENSKINRDYVIESAQKEFDQVKWQSEIDKNLFCSDIISNRFDKACNDGAKVNLDQVRNQVHSLYDEINNLLTASPDTPSINKKKLDLAKKEQEIVTRYLKRVCGTTVIVVLVYFAYDYYCDLCTRDTSEECEDEFGKQNELKKKT